LAHTRANLDVSGYGLSSSLCTLLLTGTFDPARRILGRFADSVKCRRDGWPMKYYLVAN